MVKVSGKENQSEVRCSGCGEILVYTSMDVQSYRHDLEQWNGYIVCPRLACQKITKVPHPNRQED